MFSFIQSSSGQRVILLTSKVLVPPKAARSQFNELEHIDGGEVILCANFSQFEAVLGTEAHFQSDSTGPSSFAPISMQPVVAPKKSHRIKTISRSPISWKSVLLLLDQSVSLESQFEVYVDVPARSQHGEEHVH